MMPKIVSEDQSGDMLGCISWKVIFVCFSLNFLSMYHSPPQSNLIAL